MKLKKVSQPRAKFTKGTLAVPITRLYDQGMMIRTTEVLGPRLEKYSLIIHPKDSEKLSLTEGSQAEIKIKNESYTGLIQLNDKVPEGVILVPKSMGIQLAAPANAEIKGLD